MAYSIRTTKLDPQPMLAVRATTVPAELGDVLRQLMSEVWEDAAARGVEVVGPPFARYYDFHDDHVDLEVGFPVGSAQPPGGRVEGGELPGGKAAETMHRGPYDDVGAAHDAIGDWVLKNQRDPRGAPWESYLTDPAREPDPSKWQTRVTWPLR
ncbi:MAG: GyrI-like domain-containing protein [Solirubrobacterales bacterium]